jgi:hypothetical protein
LCYLYCLHNFAPYKNGLFTGAAKSGSGKRGQAQEQTGAYALCEEDQAHAQRKELADCH